MQALVRVQSQVRDQRARLSHDGSRKSMFAETNGLWESRYLQDIRDRKSLSRDGSCIADDWDDRPHKLEEIDAMLQSRKEAALKREKALAYAFSHQIWRSSRNTSAGNENELEERTKWLDRWMATKQWESNRVSTDKRDPIKTVEIDTSRPYSYSATNVRRSQHQKHLQRQASPHSIASPHHRANSNVSLHQSPVTPPPSKIRPVQVRSASPRCLKEEKCYSTAHTPNFGSSNCFSGAMFHYGTGGAATASMPNYMAATESAKAKVRSQSAPRTRPSTPDRERGGSAKKRLSYPVPEPCGNLGNGCSSFSQNLRSPSFRTVHGGHFGMEQQSNLSSCYTDSLGGEISPCSTTDIRRWLR
ncbi:hypothetical protein L1049_021967 [Liquidambar formosana]|uniref:DUF4005 domain-containing protein n=1 Tax=Liquidambar formosana TaxID=63359 RepID=A0AAP0RBP2_LIQFO